MCKWVLFWPRYTDEKMQKQDEFETKLSRQEVTYQHDYETEADGYCWRQAVSDYPNLWEEWELPKKFELDEIVVHSKAVVIDRSGRRMTMSDIDTLRDREMHVAQGKWLSDAGKYSKGSEGETNGPSGLSFL